MIVSAMMLIYVVLGTVMEELTMVLLTIPLFFPDRHRAGLRPVWFGVLIVMVVQIGLISPPVGMNMFVLNALLPGRRPGRHLPRLLALRAGAGRHAGAVLIAFPQISCGCRR
jgi:TRAP-type C4-dicarboxylate transport system permease large subunit